MEWQGLNRESERGAERERTQEGVFSIWKGHTQNPIKGSADWATPYQTLTALSTHAPLICYALCIGVWIFPFQANAGSVFERKKEKKDSGLWALTLSAELPGIWITIHVRRKQASEFINIKQDSKRLLKTSHHYWPNQKYLISSSMSSKSANV